MKSTLLLLFFVLSFFTPVELIKLVYLRKSISYKLDGIRLKNREMVDFPICLDKLFESCSPVVSFKKVRECVFSNEDSSLIEQDEYKETGIKELLFAAKTNCIGLQSNSKICVKINNKKKKIRMKWIKLPEIPSVTSTAPLGVSAPFTAIWKNQLIVAGGCNFPEKPIIEGGKKRYYSEVYTLNLEKIESEQWKLIGRLPHEVAYGAAVLTTEGVVCVGGNNNLQSFAEAYLLIPEENKIQIISLPSLPVKLDNLSAAAINNKVYVIGGNANGKPSNKFFCLDLSEKEKKWIELKDFPGAARVQPILIAQNFVAEKQLYLIGGFQPMDTNRPARISNTMLVYSPRLRTWSEESILPVFADGSFRTLTGGAGVAFGKHKIIYVGGVNYDRFMEAIDRPRKMKEAKESGNSSLCEALEKGAKEYLFHSIEWYRFNTDIISYDTRLKKWEIRGAYEQAARAGAGIAIYNKQLIIVNGELKPGVRTPQINSCFIE